MRSKLMVAVLLVVLGFAGYAGKVLATPGTGFVGTTLATATFGDLFSFVHTKTPQPWTELLYTHGSTDLYVQQNTWQPGGSTGWHTHPGPSYVIVTVGSVTEYLGNDPTCTPHVYTAGTANDSFTDIGGGSVHLVRNETAQVAQTVAVQFVPAGAMRRQDAPNPGHCSLF